MPNLRVLRQGVEHVLDVQQGANLRRALLAARITPYTAMTQRLNCGGRGICATCGVWIESGAPQPLHWHDRLADGFGYARLSCQVSVEDDMTIRILDDKWVWGARDPKRATLFKPHAPSSE